MSNRNLNMLKEFDFQTYLTLCKEQYSGLNDEQIYLGALCLYSNFIHDSLRDNIKVYELSKNLQNNQAKVYWQEGLGKRLQMLFNFYNYVYFNLHPDRKHGMSIDESDAANQAINLYKFKRGTR